VKRLLRTLRDLYRMAGCTTLAEIGEQNANWMRRDRLRGRDTVYPNMYADVLEDLNRLGFVVDHACTGVDTEHMSGRAVVVGFATEEVKNWLDGVVYFGYDEQHDHNRFGFWVLDLYTPSSSRRRARGLATTRNPDTEEATCWTAEQRSARDIRRDYWFCLRGQRALRSAWQVTIYGPFGSNELWSLLRTACDARLAAQADAAGVR
jgi:hypothetical protein